MIKNGLIKLAMSNKMLFINLKKSYKTTLKINNNKLHKIR